MKNIKDYKDRFFSLLESEMGNVKPLISEGDMNEGSGYKDNPQIRLFVPEEMENVIIELGERPTPGTVIEVFNDMFEGDAPLLVNFNEDLFLFIDEDGTKLTPEDIYEMINEAIEGDNMDDTF